MTFQTVGSVFHNIVLPGKFLNVGNGFLRGLYILCTCVRKNLGEGVGGSIRIIIRLIFTYK